MRFERTAEAPFAALICSASLSSCRLYRYDLWRKWGDEPYCMFVGLNPSTADETQDDPTIRRCVGYAKRWNYGGLCMVNLFAFRATQPKDMMTAKDPIGPDNDRTLKTLSQGAGIVIAAWGKDGNHTRSDTRKAGNGESLSILTTELSDPARNEHQIENRDVMVGFESRLTTKLTYGSPTTTHERK